MDNHRQPAQPGSAHHLIPRHGTGERGNALLMVLLLLVAGSVLTVAVLDSLLGEIQGAIGYRYAVQALAASEAGANYGAAKVNDTGGDVYAGEIDRPVTHGTQGQIAVYDVTVRCSNNTVPSNPNPCAGAPEPSTRIITSTGYAPSKTNTLGRRTVVMTVRESLITSLDFAVCGRDGATFDRNNTIFGNIGSNLNISLLGPAGSWARTLPFAGQAGNATAGGTVTCSGSCGAPTFQVAGTTTNNYPGGVVCPVLPPVTCTPGSTDYTGGAGVTYTISAALGNTSRRDVTLGSGSTLVFATTSASEVLTVQMDDLTIGQNSRVRVTGPGKIVLHLAGRMVINQGTLFGVDSLDLNIPPGNLVVQSCNADTGGNAVEFHETGRINAIILAPNGTVQLDQAALSSGAVQSRIVDFDRDTTLTYNVDNLGLPTGVFNTLTSWREQP